MIRKAARLCSPATKPCSFSSWHLQLTFQLLDRKMCLSLCGWETGEQEICLSGYRKADVLCTLKTRQPDELQHLCLRPCNQSNLFVCAGLRLREFEEAFFTWYQTSFLFRLQDKTLTVLLTITVFWQSEFCCFRRHFEKGKTETRINIQCCISNPP